MSEWQEWTRRRFLAASGAGLATLRMPGLARGQQGNALPPPTVITGGVRPLFRENTARPLRYRPDGGDFLIENGSEFFNRPIYGVSSEFRVDAGDRPEFSLYLPGHGGNLKFGFVTRDGAKWTADAERVVARYRPGRMMYEIRDAALKGGSLGIELLTSAAGSGLMVKVEPRDVPPGTRLVWAFGGLSGRKGRRNGDIGCEVEPVSQFFQVRAEECRGNDYTHGYNPQLRCSSVLKGSAATLLFTFPEGARCGTVDFEAWKRPPRADQGFLKVAEFPILLGSVEATGSALYLSIDQRKAGESTTPHPETEFAPRGLQVARMSATVTMQTPDAYVDAMGPALGVVADALWDARQECVMHGCVAWRSALAGWRGPYVLDATGAHERAKLHFRHWLNKQNVSAIATSVPATGPADAGMHMARKEALLHSNGDLSNNHYDMNLVFFDVLLRHLRWTGDIDFAREIWPAFQRHLAWEQRLFRREFTVDGRQLPLYEAYAAIWASDNLQYSGGGAAHSSAYNVFSFRFAAQLGALLGEDPAPYQREADLIHEAMQRLLWQPAQGAFAEAKDLMGPQTVYTNPALWTVYHTIDSEVPTPRQAWRMVAERLATLKHIPMEGEGVPAGCMMLACTDWLPYLWSLTLVLLAENMHFALAMWQAGMADEAFRVFKGGLLDSMYMGLCPGDFHMTSALDSHRQEAQRDFGDPTGISARALVEGLFGVRPNLIGGTITLQPGFPSEWTHASMTHRDFDFSWRRDEGSEVYEFSSRLGKDVPVLLRVAARTISLPEATLNGARFACAFDAEAVGRPVLLVPLPSARAYRVELTWHGEAPAKAPEIKPGNRFDFVTRDEADCRWVMPVLRDAVPTRAFAVVPHLTRGLRAEPVELTAVFTHGITEIFERSYAEPRSPLCTLSIPDTLLGGWANIDPAPAIDDAGLRGAGGLLQTPLGVAFQTPVGRAPNCVLLSYFRPDAQSVTVPLRGSASGVYLLVTGTTLPQCSRMQHALATVAYADGSRSTLAMRNPETWWPIEQDYLLDDYLFVDEAPLPPRVSLRTGETRLLAYETFKGRGRTVAGGAATIVYLELDAGKTLASLRFEVNLYGIVVALLGATLVRGRVAG